MLCQTEQNADKITIIGVGSPFGDDTLGWRAVEWLQRGRLANHYHPIQFSFLQSDRPGALLLEQLRGSVKTIIVDAMQTGLSPGTIRHFTVEQLSHGSGLFSTHGLGVAEALALGHSLAIATGDDDFLPEKLSIVGIEMGQENSDEPWQERLETVIHQILASWME